MLFIHTARGLPSLVRAGKMAASGSRAYGTDEYWIERYAKKSNTACEEAEDDEETDEWLLSFAHLKPLLKLPSRAVVLDLGCGLSTLAFDLSRELDDASSVIAVDIAPAAIESMIVEKQKRVAKGDVNVRKVTFQCMDLCCPDAWAPDSSKFDAVIDKSTSDGLLCDLAQGAGRVRAMYAAVGAALRSDAEALLCIVSWRDPTVEGVEWILESVIGGVRDGSYTGDGGRGNDRNEGTAHTWALDVHSITRSSSTSVEAAQEEEDAEDEPEAAEETGPHVYLLRRRPCRRSRRRRTSSTTQQTADGEEENGEEELVMRHHVHHV